MALARLDTAPVPEPNATTQLEKQLDMLHQELQKLESRARELTDRMFGNRANSTDQNVPKAVPGGVLDRLQASVHDSAAVTARLHEELDRLSRI